VWQDLLPVVTVHWAGGKEASREEARGRMLVVPVTHSTLAVSLDV
jgi:hypothetical protein